MDWFDDTVADILSEPDAAILQVLSKDAAKSIHLGIDAAEGGKHCDWIIGWAGLNDEPPLDVLVLPSDVSILSDLLLVDRKNFLKALTMTYSPGVAGIMFLLWRYWCRQVYVL